MKFLTKNKRIVSPMARGNGAYIVHTLLEDHLPEYQVVGHNPYWTVFPFLLPLIVRTKGIDVIHTTPDYARFFYRKSVPLVLTFHNYVLDRWMKPYCSRAQKIHYAFDLRLWIRLALEKADMVTAVSQFLADLVKKELNFSRPIRVIYNGIDTDKFSPSSSSQSSQKEFRVFFSGNLTRRKGVHWLPSIAKQLNKNIHIFYTQGLLPGKNLKPYPKLHPLGPVRFEDMASRYRQMDLLIMPSIREGFGLAVAEAMACGLPIVASECSAIPELVDDGKGGFLCPVGDVNAFADKINFLADSPTLRYEMGEYNRTKVEKKFTLDRMVKEYRELFENIIS